MIPFRRFAGAALALLLVLCTAAAFAKASPGRIGVYCNLNAENSSPPLLRKTMRQMKAAGVDFVLPYAKTTGGEVRWESRVAPASLVTNPHYMGRVVHEAHQAGLKVYPVLCVATEGGETKVNVVLEKNPSWAFVMKGERIGYIDPGNAAARRYEIDLAVELAGMYDVDGLSLDYMRWPNRIGYSETGREEFLKRRGVDLARLTAVTSVTLETEGGKAAATTATADARQDPAWSEWREWRRTQLNTFMGELHAAVRKARPGLPVSTYCWGAHTYTGNFETSQDWKTWIAEGWLDWINPSGYRYDDEVFRKAAMLNRENVPAGFPYYITIGVSTSHGKLPDMEALRRQMAMSKEAGADGLVFFTWEALVRFLPEAGTHIADW